MNPNSHTGLLPCPMCGGTAALNTVRYSAKHVAEQQWEQDTFHGVNCIACGLDNKGIVGHLTPETAAAAWNRRDQSNGPSEREAAIDECRDAAHDAIHHAIERMDLCAFVKGHVDEALLALKNAAPQIPHGEYPQGLNKPVGESHKAGSDAPAPARASSEAGADDVLWKIRVELAALVANPDKPDWMPALTNGNPADAECLSRAYALTKSNATLEGGKNG